MGGRHRLVLGFDHDEALTLGKTVAGLNARAEGMRLGICQRTPKDVAEQRKKLRTGKQLHVDLLLRAVLVTRTPEEPLALAKDKPVNPEVCSANSRASSTGHGKRSRGPCGPRPCGRGE